MRLVLKIRKKNRPIRTKDVKVGQLISIKRLTSYNTDGRGLKIPPKEEWVIGRVTEVKNNWLIVVNGYGFSGVYEGVYFDESKEKNEIILMQDEN